KLEGLNERLITRFRWGLTAEIDAPDYQTRKEILMMMMKNEGLEVADEVVEYIAFNIQENLRDLEGAIISLFAQATLNQKDIDLELAKQVVKNYVKTSSKELSIEDIQKMVCQFYNIGYEELLTTSRKQKIVEARQITMYLAKTYTNSTLKAIGNHFSGKDHTTVIHSCQKVESLLDVDEDYKEKFLEIQHKVKLASI
ncbi:MAG: chromosomal replication initiator protein DnaA, partial [Taibaiella sp.]|nr:chromosomal replication initiator protein DnaA [Taibaiella sp.]